MSDSDPKECGDTYSEEETVARREVALKRMLATPHKPHKPNRADSKARPDGSVKKPD
jgi:hypothetical protein